MAIVHLLNDENYWKFEHTKTNLKGDVWKRTAGDATNIITVLIILITM